MKLEKQNTQHKIKITFTKSRSKYFDNALSIAQGISGYKAFGHGSNQIHVVETEDIFTDDIKSLLTFIFSWKGITISINDKNVACTHGFYNPYMDVYDCQKYHVNDDYCVGRNTPSSDQRYFGCRHEGDVTLTPEGNSWFQFGKLSKDSKYFDINKQDIKNRLHKVTSRWICVLCPFFSFARIDKGINTLPDRIDLTKDKRFVIKYSELTPSKSIGIQMEEEAYYEELQKLNTQRFTQVYQQLETGHEQSTRYVPDVKYSDIAAQDKVIEEIENVIGLPIKHPDYYEEVNVEFHKGVLLYGPPGNGKTLIAKAVANEANAHFELINGPDILSKWVGESEENLRAVFERAKEHSPSIILIDEIDSVFSKRDDADRQHEISLISQFLVLLDGLETRGLVMVIGTTNRIEAVDSAIRRPGRFDYHIEVPSPDINGISAILKTQLSKAKTDNIDFVRVAQMIDGFSGAEVAALCREAGMIAIKKALKSKIKAEDVFISNQNLIDAVDLFKAKRFK